MSPVAANRIAIIQMRFAIAVLFNRIMLPPWLSILNLVYPGELTGFEVYVALEEFSGFESGNPNVSLTIKFGRHLVSRNIELTYRPSTPMQSN